MKTGILIVVAMFCLSGCQVYNLGSVSESKQLFRDDIARIETFASVHPWSVGELSGDTDVALRKVDFLERMGPAYLELRDTHYAVAQRIDASKSDAVRIAEQQRLNTYERRVAIEAGKQQMGSFAEAYFKLFEMSNYQPRFEESAIGKSRIRDGVYLLDLPFQVRKCTADVCFASATVGIGSNSSIVTLAFVRSVPYTPGQIMPSSYIEVLGPDQNGTLVVRVLASKLDSVT